MSTPTNNSDYFTATQNGEKLFETDHIEVKHEQGYITIEGSRKLGLPDGQAIKLTIDPSTTNGEHEFKRGEKLVEVYYLNRQGTQYAYRGTFNSELDNTNRKYRISFVLEFHGNHDAIHVQLDVSG
ncbi:hypothetical protein [Pseudomonas fluorescens]|uniref:Uncharacterized protein n=1 Tax=Pseudomonas fluorescens TaxID=294 RepID=A0A7Z3C852_PSEFL|nr:hypothetical protein [Pseudomonas fluorescens]QJP97343.1 hypothetical protein C6Y56_23210 [Pseudomonas fluorescens]